MNEIERSERKMFDFAPSKTSENALLVSRSSNVSLANADTIQVAITLQAHASYYISNTDDVQALVELGSQSDNNK